MIQEILICCSEVIVVTVILMYYGLLGVICLGLALYVRRRAARDDYLDTLVTQWILSDLFRHQVHLKPRELGGRWEPPRAGEQSQTAGIDAWLAVKELQG